MLKNKGVKKKNLLNPTTLFSVCEHRMYSSFTTPLPMKSEKKKKKKNAVGIANKVSRILAANCGWDAIATTAM